ncbi:F-actin-capping protein subunit beta [Arthrobotrys musiformis]|uniref:F-actin-capping protein subunit beta n=1 Tax=Arthrobotrys musiformis TaxID=47236 RepID=A0AAV9W003_9PEZI
MELGFGYVMDTFRSFRLPARYYTLAIPAVATLIVLTVLFNDLNRSTNTFVPIPQFLSKQRGIPKTRGDRILYGGHFFPHRTWTVPQRLDKFETLFLDSYTEYRAFLNRQSGTYSDAVKNYKKRYNRSPPPGFEKWFQYAQSKGALVIDDYDVIEDSIAPYRNLPKADLVRRLKELREYDPEYRVSEIILKNGFPQQRGGGLWHLLDWDFSRYLPDIEIYFNTWDEPFVFPQEKNRSHTVEFFNAGGKPWWPGLVEHCELWEGRSMRGKGKSGYIANIQDAKEALDVCAHPEYDGTHGFFNAPASLTGTKQLVPIFSVNKLSVFKDLLLPSSGPWHPNFMQNKGIREFAGKQKKLYWRGTSTGGEHNGENALKSHRIRLARISQENPEFIDAEVTGYTGNLESLQQQWREFGEPERADHDTENGFAFLMDMDGNGMSGRFYRLLRSKAVVFKSTAMQQWHDDRLFPWVHYVPVRLGMKELVELVKWFATTERGNEIGRRIAEESDWWSRTGVREDDAKVYTYRLLLEYAALFA